MLEGLPCRAVALWFRQIFALLDAKDPLVYPVRQVDLLGEQVRLSRREGHDGGLEYAIFQ